MILIKYIVSEMLQRSHAISIILKVTNINYCKHPSSERYDYHS